MNLSDYFRTRGAAVSQRDDGILHVMPGGELDTATLVLLAAEGRFGDDLLLELHADQTYADEEQMMLLDVANTWNRTHRLSRVRVEPSRTRPGCVVVVLDCWLPASKGLDDEVVVAFLDASIADMLSFWASTEVGG